MSEKTPNLQLPYILAAQAQKHVTHNEAIRSLDALTQISVEDKDLSTPPLTPSEGERYIIAATASGVWLGKENNIAAYQDGAWMFYAPEEGWVAWVRDEDNQTVFDGTSWQTLSGGGAGVASLNPATGNLLGINTTADTTNRLAISSSATLFDHQGSDHQLKINKQTETDTASVMFQTGYSGRAEFGLTGDDDFHMKVSPDGSTFFDGIVIDKATGAVTFPNTVFAGGSVSSVFGRAGAVTSLSGDYNYDEIGGVSQNVLIGRLSTGTGEQEALTASEVRTLLNIEDGADLTDTINVTSALNGAAFPTTTVVGTDKVIIQDADDSSTIKTVTAQSIADLASGGGGAGDVVGPSSATDDAIVIYDGTTGKLVQNSVVTIDASGNISTAGMVDGRDVSADGAKLDTIETAATADQTGSEIKALYEAEPDTNVYDDAAVSKLSAIEATADVTDENNVTTALSGAALTAIAVATDDKVLIQDADDTDSLKSVTAQSIANLKTDEMIQDVAGAMFTGNNETLITATYQDADGTIDLVVDNDLANYDNSTSGFITSVDTDDISVTSEARGDILFRGASGWERLPAGTSGKFLKTQSTAGDPVWESIAGGGDMLAANNLSDVANAATARANLGIGASTDLFALALRLADLEGDALGIVGGIADPFNDETDVDTTASLNQVYDAINDLYCPYGSVGGAATVSTYIGNTIDVGGLAAIFDGITSQGKSVGARKFSALNCYFGADFSASPKAIASAVVYGSNDVGFVNTNNPNITLVLRGKNGSPPAGRTDGTSIGTLATFADTADESAGRIMVMSDTTTQYDYVWIDFSRDGSGADDICIAELLLTETATISNMTLQSNTFSAESTPSTGRLCVLAKPNEAIALNTDLIGSVSRDGGTTYAVATLTAQTTYSDGTILYEDSSIDISGQPPGTSMKWKISTSNNKNIDVSGVVYQWS